MTEVGYFHFTLFTFHKAGGKRQVCNLKDSRLVENLQTVDLLTAIDEDSRIVASVHSEMCVEEGLSQAVAVLLQPACALLLYGAKNDDMRGECPVAACRILCL